MTAAAWLLRRRQVDTLTHVCWRIWTENTETLNDQILISRFARYCVQNRPTQASNQRLGGPNTLTRRGRSSSRWTTWHLTWGNEKNMFKILCFCRANDQWRHWLFQPHRRRKAQDWETPPPAYFKHSCLMLWRTKCDCDSSTFHSGGCDIRPYASSSAKQTCSWLWTTTTKITFDICVNVNTKSLVVSKVCDFSTLWKGTGSWYLRRKQPRNDKQNIW